MLKLLIAKRDCIYLSCAALLLLAGCGDQAPKQVAQSGNRISDGQTILQDRDILTLAQMRELIAASEEAINKGHLDEAIENYSQVLRHSDTQNATAGDLGRMSAEVLRLRGQAFMMKGFPQIAIQDYDDAIRMGNDEMRANTYVLRARAESSLKRWSKAITDCGRSIRLYPGNGEAFLVRGRALAALGQSDRADQSFREAEKLGVVAQTTLKPPLEASSIAILSAKRSLDSGLPGVACEILKKSIFEGDNSWETSGLLAMAQFQMQDYYRAIVASTRAIELNPQYADGYRIRGMANLKHGAYDQAVTDLLAAIALNESLAEELKPQLSEARQRGGIAPTVRTRVTAKIQKLVELDDPDLPDPGRSERWLLELIAKRRSAENVEQFKALLAETDDVESLGWLADFLMLDTRATWSQEIRNYLNRDPGTVSELEQRLWDSIKSSESAASSGVNVFPDLNAYAIEYNYLELLQLSLASATGSVKFDHVYWAMEKESLDCLRLILPKANLLRREVAALLRQAIAKNRKGHARLIVHRYPQSLTWELIQFLDLDNEM